MKRLPHLIRLAFLVVPSLASAEDQLGAQANCTTPPMGAELRLLQGTWEGVDVGDPSHQKVTITITNRSLHFYRDTNFWFDTTFTLPPGTEPKQLHATIQKSANGDAQGDVVGAIFKIEGGIFTLASYGTDTDDPPTTFDSYPSRYVLRKVPPKSDKPAPE